MTGRRQRISSIGQSVAALALFGFALTAVGCGPAETTAPSTGPSGNLLVRVDEVPVLPAPILSSTWHARVVGEDGEVVLEWPLAMDAVQRSVPAGEWRLEAWTIFHSDFIECTADPAAPSGERCSQATFAPTQVCSLDVGVDEGELTTVTYHALPEGRCELVAD